MPSSRIVLSSAFAFACALGLAEPAFAQTTYRLALSGEVDHVVDCWESVPQCSGPHDIQYGWGGILTVVIDSAANGTYTGPDLESVTFAGNIGSFTLARQQPDRFYVATVTDGRVSSLELNPFLDNTPDTLAWVSVDA